MGWSALDATGLRLALICHFQSFQFSELMSSGTPNFSNFITELYPRRMESSNAPLLIPFVSCSNIIELVLAI